jgi:hypothetical protein
MTATEDETREAFSRCVHPITGEDRDTNLSKLSAFIARQQTKLQKMEARSQAPVTFDSEERCSVRAAPYLAQIKLWIHELTGRLFEIQLTHFKKVLAITKVIYEHVLKTPDAVADCGPLEAVARRRITTDREYQIYRSRRHLFLHQGRSLISRSVTVD